MARVSSGLISAVESGAGHNWEPYRQYNFELEIQGLSDTHGLVLAVEATALPNTSSDEIELGYGNDSIFLQGKAHVDQITCTYRDFADPAIATILLKWRKDHHYNPETGIQYLAKDYKKTGILRQYLPDESRPREWRLLGLWMPVCNHGSLENNTSDIVRIEATFRFDRAIPGSGFNV